MKVGAYRVKWFQISKHKVLEFQVSRWPDSPMFAFGIWRRPTGDHKGIDISVILFRHEFRMDFYDTRHEEDM